MKTLFPLSMLCSLLSLLFLHKTLMVSGSFGGHDLFTSLAQLEQLWHNERDIVALIRSSAKRDVSNLFNISDALNSYVSQHTRLQLECAPNYDFLGHPINAYHLVRHVAHGWARFKRAVDSNPIAAQSKFIQRLMNREASKLPDLYDVRGAAFGLVRLYSLYRFNLTSFVEEGVIKARLENGQKVLSQPSLIRLSSHDLYLMGEEAHSEGYLDAATDLMALAVDKAEMELEQDVDLSVDHFDYTPRPKYFRSRLDFIRKVHDQWLDKRGMKSRFHRSHQFPFDAKLRKKKKFKKPFVLEESILSREQVEKYENSKDDNQMAHFNFVSEVQKDMLCRGQQLRSENTLGRLYCTYASGSSLWLRLAPLKLEVNSFDPYHVTMKELMFDHECDDITAFLGPMLDFPPGRMNSASRKNDWTMKNCWPVESQHVGLAKLNRRIEHLTGLRADSSKGFSEGFMCGNYGIGGHYFIHPDYHHPSPQLYASGTRGNRLATILSVLQAPEAGGATVWPNAGISVFPEKGSGVFWFNLRQSDEPDPFTRHSACPVLLGQKWIGNKWVGYNAQWNGRRCGLDQNQFFQGPYH